MIGRRLAQRLAAPAAQFGFEDLGHFPPQLAKSNFILDPNTVAMSKLIGGKMQANNQTV